MMQENNRVWAIVPAAGIGQRMKTTLPKQYLKLHEKTVLEHTLHALAQHSKIQQIMVCLNPQDTFWSELSLSQTMSIRSVDIQTTAGGETRAQSVLNGLQAIKDQASADDWVLVHDAARPCVSLTSLNKLVTELQYDSVGGLLAIPSKDTLKQAVIDDDGSVRAAETLDRNVVWRAQTPQMFRYGLLKQGLQAALKQSFEVTDEASAIEYLGYQARLIEGEENNFKITTPDDLVLAEKLLKSEKIIK